MKTEIIEIQSHSPAPAAQPEAVSFLAMIERAARDPAVDVDKFERLMLMKERVEANTALKAFNRAVALAKGEIPPIIKTCEVDFSTGRGRTQYRFEDFASIARLVDPVLQKYGLTYRFKSQQHGNILRVACVLTHEDGHSEETVLESAEDHSGNKNAIQAIGSAATYLQRYTLKLALGLASARDDDAQAISRIEVSAEPRANVDELMEAGRAAAQGGMTSLGEWWTKTLSVQQRRDLGVAVLNELKQIAEGLQ